MRPSVPTLWSFNGGYVDTAGFLALHGLFTSHVTGNFVTFGAAVAQGTSGVVAKLLALPVFCGVIVLTRTLAHRLAWPGRPILESAIVLKVLLLGSAAAFALAWGPFATGDGPTALVTGMTLVAAMAIQNAASRVHLPKAPPTTIMTGTSTQLMLDIADLAAASLTPGERAVVLPRIRAMAVAVASFALGCVAAALLFMRFEMKVFLLPPLVAAASLLVVVKERPRSGPEGETAQASDQVVDER